MASLVKALIVEIDSSENCDEIEDGKDNVLAETNVGAIFDKMPATTVAMHRRTKQALRTIENRVEGLYRCRLQPR